MGGTSEVLRFFRTTWCTRTSTIRSSSSASAGGRLHRPAPRFPERRLCEGAPLRGRARLRLHVEGRCQRRRGPERHFVQQCNADGKVVFVRDIPAPSLKPPPLGRL